MLQDRNQLQPHNATIDHPRNMAVWAVPLRDAYTNFVPPLAIFQKHDLHGISASDIHRREHTTGIFKMKSVTVLFWAGFTFQRPIPVWGKKYTTRLIPAAIKAAKISKRYY